MLKKKLLSVFAICLLAVLAVFSLASCQPSQPRESLEVTSEEKYGLVMVNLVYEEYYYLLFFNGERSMTVYYDSIRVGFNANIGEPKVIFSPSVSYYTLVTVYFRDREQMLEYWLVK